MRSAVLVILCACGSTPPPAAPPPAPPVPIATVVSELPKTCTDAAFGIDRVTRDLRPPEQEIVPVMRGRCAEAQWSQTTIDCFTKLTADDPAAEEHLAACVTTLPLMERAPLLVEIKGAEPDETAQLAQVVTRLGTVSVGIASCDQFVAAVLRMMDCTALETTVRIQLGTETVEAWNLPVDKISQQNKAKLAGACNQSLSSLKRHASDLACTL